MAWLDPQFVTGDYAYNSMRSALLRVVKHNATHPKNHIGTVYCPDFFRIRSEGPGGEKLTEIEYQDTVSQMLLATRSILGPSVQEELAWAQALLITTEVVKSGALTNEQDLVTLANEGKLESRGLYNETELEIVMKWARDEANAELRKIAAKVLAACLHRSDTQFNLPKANVARRISSSSDGCLPFILDMVLEGSISVHREIPFEELTLHEKIGNGGEGSVWRGKWGDIHVAVKEFKKDVNYNDFIREISIMCLIQHPSLIRSYGGVSTNGRMMIVQELMQANLFDVLAEKSIELDTGLNL
eukprot:TRINITY_DN6509_c0_g1_i1.p1 TRINITY_DN6509_c0_g1~~TRINITY_DN6509_c0_g1_i1.p1  ORF type:complete len:339 (-),score=62.10 TRINITY_DN6509_c0_g1_i1:79-981(-)